MMSAPPLNEQDELEAIKNALIIEYMPPPPPPPMYPNPQAAEGPARQRVHGRHSARSTPRRAPAKTVATKAVATKALKTVATKAVATKALKTVAAKPAPKKSPVMAWIAPVMEIQVSLQPKPEDAVRLALRHKRAIFEHCYELELRKQAVFSGFLVVGMSVAMDGKVTHTRVVEGNPREAAVGACIAKHLRTLKLPGVAYDADLLLPIRLDAKLPVS